MNTVSPKHHRHTIRLQGHDYTGPGAYFVTICTKDRACLLDDPVLNAIIQDVWRALPSWFPTIQLDEFVIMPNHIHFLVWLGAGDQDVGIPLAGIGDDAGNQNVGIPLAGIRGDAGDQTVGIPLAGIQDAGIRDDAGIGDEACPRPYGRYIIPQPQKINAVPTLGEVVGAFKSLVFKVYLDWIEAAGDPSRRAKFWQGNYYEHIVRNDRELHAIRRYIMENPAQWDSDRDNPDNHWESSQPWKVEDYLQDLEGWMGEMAHRDQP